MNYLSRQTLDLGADSQEDAQISTESLRLKETQQLAQLEALGAMVPDHNDSEPILKQAELRHTLAQTQVELGQGKTAWGHAQAAFNVYLNQQKWELAAACCDTLFRCNLDNALIALGHGLWLSITFPVEVTLTISQLQHVIDETPEESDGAAVAAAMAAYINEIRGNAQKNDDVALAVGQMLNDVARRHSQVNTQDEFDQWFARLELDDPGKLVVRMRNIIDVLVQDNWWFDRAALQALIPQES